MKLIFKSSPFSWKNLLNKVPGFKPKDNRSLACLNTAQFLGALNDNIFKLVLVYLLIDIKGAAHASTILSAAGAIFVIPFLLFSSTAGVLADRFSKQRLLTIMKAVEMAIMLLAIFAFAYKSAAASYTLLFLLASHSAAFGPSKYGIIPELVSKENISRANGLITSFTYLAIIVGTFLASFLTEVTNRKFPLIALFCLALAAIGFASTFGIKKTAPQGSQKKFNPLFVREIIRTLKVSAQKKHLFIAIMGSSYFLFIGSFTQLNIIPFAMESLHMSEVAGGYLFLSTALGIALGAFICGKAFRKYVDLGVSCLASIMIALFFFLIFLFPTHTWAVVVSLILLGIFGGCFIVPFDTFIQLHSPDEQRGQMIAAANFMSFVGVLIASLALFLFSDILGLSSKGGFGMMGLVTLLFSFILISRLSDVALHYLSKKFYHPFFDVKIIGAELLAKKPLLLLKGSKKSSLFLLLGMVPDLNLLIPKPPLSRRFFLKFFYSFQFVPSHPSLEEIIHIAKPLLDENIHPCLLLDRMQPKGRFEKESYVREFFKTRKVAFVEITIERSATQEVVIALTEIKN